MYLHSAILLISSIMGLFFLDIFIIQHFQLKIKGEDKKSYYIFYSFFYYVKNTTRLSRVFQFP